MAASSTAQPPGVVKTLTDDKKRKRPVKKRRGKKLTVAESEAESEAQAEAEAEAEAEAARSSKRRVARQHINTRTRPGIRRSDSRAPPVLVAEYDDVGSPDDILLAGRCAQGVTPGPSCASYIIIVVQAAKKGAKKGGKKGGGKKKGPGSLMDMNLLMVESFRRNVGRPLMENVEINSAAKELYLAPFTWEEVVDTPASDILALDELSDAQEQGVLEATPAR
eukprot:jgi/Tetstr1/430576/TSEL_020374.t1